MSPVEIDSVAAWNQTLRAATASGQVAVVDFWATWCGPCKAIAPAFDKLADQHAQHAFLRVDVDAQKAIAAKYQISAMPTFLIFKAGKVVDSLKGADPGGLTRLVKKHAAGAPVSPLPEKAEEAKNAGNELFKAGSFAAAAAKYGEALALAPDSAVLFTNRSLAQLKAGDAAAAVADARRAVELDPKAGKGWVRLGDGLAATPDGKAEAETAYRKAQALLPAGLMKTEIETKLSAL